jgi:hypothetical protein
MSAHQRMSRVLSRTAPEFSRCTGTALALLPQRGRASPTLTLTDYKAPNYWLGYRFGFVRRGLPGALLARVVGGPPTYRQVEVAAATLSRAAALSVVPIAIRARRHVPPGLPRTVARGLIVLSPLTCSLLQHDVGRYDAVGVLVLAGLAGVGSALRRLSVPVGTVLLAAAVGVATASEEFLLAVVAPAALAAAAQLSGAQELSPGRRLLLSGAVLGPGAVVAAASMLVPPPPGALSAARDEATRAGSAPPAPWETHSRRLTADSSRILRSSDCSNRRPSHWRSRYGPGSTTPQPRSSPTCWAAPAVATTGSRPDYTPRSAPRSARSARTFADGGV